MQKNNMSALPTVITITEKGVLYNIIITCTKLQSMTFIYWVSKVKHGNLRSYDVTDRSHA